MKKCENLTIKPIAYVKNDFSEKFGIPRQSGKVNNLSEIIFLPKYNNPESIRGLEEFSHLWLIFDFSESHTQDFVATVRPPRLGGNKKVGVFATRSPFRPNPLGLSSVKLVRIEESKKYGKVLIVSGADLLDGTPIFDIKPYIPYSDCHKKAKGGFSDKFINYKLKVKYEKNILSVIPKDKRKILIACLQEDPRPSYQKDERLYKMKFANFDVSFKVIDKTLFIEKIDVIKETDIIKDEE